MFFTKKGISDKNDKNFQSNLILYEPDQSTKIGVKTLGVKEFAQYLPRFCLKELLYVPSCLVIGVKLGSLGFFI